MIIITIIILRFFFLQVSDANTMLKYLKKCGGVMKGKGRGGGEADTLLGRGGGEADTLLVAPSTDFVQQFVAPS